MSCLLSYSTPLGLGRLRNLQPKTHRVGTVPQQKIECVLRSPDAGTLAADKWERSNAVPPSTPQVHVVPDADGATPGKAAGQVADTGAKSNCDMKCCYRNCQPIDHAHRRSAICGQQPGATNGVALLTLHDALTLSI